MDHALGSESEVRPFAVIPAHPWTHVRFTPKAEGPGSMVGPPGQFIHGSRIARLSLRSPAKRFAVSLHSDRVADAFRAACETGGSGGSAMGGFTDRYGGRDPAKWRHMEGHRKLLARPKVAPQAFERYAN